VLQARIRIGNSYDTTSQVFVSLDTYRVFCSNLCASWGSDFSFSLRHTGEINPELFTEATKVVVDRFGNLVTKYSNWSDITLKEDDIPYYLDALCMKHNARWIKDSAMSHKSVEFNGTLWGFYNMLTRAVTHDYQGLRSKNAEYNRIRLSQNMGKFCDDKKLFRMSGSSLQDYVEGMKQMRKEQNDVRSRFEDVAVDVDYEEI